MALIKNAWLGPLENPKYLKPYALKFNMNGIEKTWELAKTFDSVAVMIYNTERKVRDLFFVTYYCKFDDLTVHNNGTDFKQ